MTTLTGKVAVITGASRGIGAALAQLLDEQGVKLGLASRRGDDLGLDAVAQPCDVRDYAQGESLVNTTVERFGRLDILVANAGVGAYAPVHERALDHELREHGIRCTNVCPGGVATDFALEAGRGRSPDVLPSMMSAAEAAEVVLFALTRPRNQRLLDLAFRPMSEPSWG